MNGGKKYQENFNFERSEQLDGGLPKTEFKVLGKREMIKLKMNDLWMGNGSKLSSIKMEDKVGKRHHWKFWKNKRGNEQTENNSNLISVLPFRDLFDYDSAVSPATTEENSFTLSIDYSSPVTSHASENVSMTTTENKSVIFTPLGPGPLAPHGIEPSTRREDEFAKIGCSNTTITDIQQPRFSPIARNSLKHSDICISTHCTVRSSRFSPAIRDSNAFSVACSSTNLATGASERLNLSSAARGSFAGTHDGLPTHTETSKFERYSTRNKVRTRAETFLPAKTPELNCSSAPEDLPLCDSVRISTNVATNVSESPATMGEGSFAMNAYDLSPVTSRGSDTVAPLSLPSSNRRDAKQTKILSRWANHCLHFNDFEGDDPNKKRQTAKDDNIEPTVPSNVIWENMEDETWIAKRLKEYCPVRLRRNKCLNYDSNEFRSARSYLTVMTLLDQEQRPYKKILFCPNKNPNKPLYRRWLNFEEDKDILDSMEHFILCNYGLKPIFAGSRPAVRKHMFRRWKNRDRERIMICEELMERCLEDPHFLNDQKFQRLTRQLKRELQDKALEPNKRPPMSFFVRKIIAKLRGNRGRIGKPPKRGSILIVLRKEPLFGVPYFEDKKNELKKSIRDFLLSI